MPKYQEYQNKAFGVLNKIAETQGEAIEAAAKVIAEHIANNGILYLLGSGHSLITALESSGRAGGMVPIDIIFDKTFGKIERLSGYAEYLLKDYEVDNGIVIVISNSGRNALPIEVALESKKRGAKVIALTSLAHSQSVTARHPSGKRLFEIADIVVDNCCEPGDAVVEIEGLPGKVGATSSVACTFIINSILVQAVENLTKMGVTPPILISANLDGSDEHNDRMRAKYKGRIRGL
ncbi:MAG TPA: SIS domain-containing protein [Armatimonadota bacterium]|nr:SIS domain-containing protein [Armatimonadota bacterium]HOP79777.1 SIS domain-containing protein [Armatimonadota bacterium]